MRFTRGRNMMLIVSAVLLAALIPLDVDAQAQPYWYRDLDPEEEITVGAGPIAVPVRMIDFYEAMEQDPVLFVQSLVDLIEMLVGEYGSIQALGFTDDQVEEIRTGMSLVLAHLTPHARTVMPAMTLSNGQVDGIRAGIGSLRRHAVNNEIDVDLDALETAMVGSIARQAEL